MGLRNLVWYAFGNRQDVQECDALALSIPFSDPMYSSKKVYVEGEFRKADIRYRRVDSQTTIDLYVPKARLQEAQLLTARIRKPSDQSTE